MIGIVAAYLGVDVGQIVRCEEWVTVLFVIVKGSSPTFVSKKILKQEPQFLSGDVVVSKAGCCYEVINQRENRVRCSPLDITLRGSYWGSEQFVFPAQQLTIITNPLSISQKVHKRLEVIAAPVKSSEKAQVQVEVVQAGVRIN
jgi:hypothetical protein